MRCNTCTRSVTWSLADITIGPVIAGCKNSWTGSISSRVDVGPDISTVAVASFVPVTAVYIIPIIAVVASVAIINTIYIIPIIAVCTMIPVLYTINVISVITVVTITSIPIIPIISVRSIGTSRPGCAIRNIGTT